MKTLLLTFIAFFISSITAHSQTMEGTYTNTWETNAGGALTYTLTLNPDHTFQFLSHRVYETSIPPKAITADGTWKNKNRLLLLTTDTASDEIDLVKRLNNNRAKFTAYSPRHRKYGKVKPSLKFFRSKVFYAKGMTLVKKEVDSVATRS